MYVIFTAMQLKKANLIYGKKDMKGPGQGYLRQEGLTASLVFVIHGSNNIYQMFLGG